MPAARIDDIHLAAVFRSNEAVTAGETGQGAGHPPDAVIVKVGNIEAAILPHGHAKGAIQLRASGRAAVAGGTMVRAAGDGRDDAIRSHPAHAIVPAVRNIEAAIRPEG